MFKSELIVNKNFNDETNRQRREKQMKLKNYGTMQFIGVQIYIGSKLDKIKGDILISTLKELYNVGGVEVQHEHDITQVVAFIPNPIKVSPNSKGFDDISLEYISKTKKLLSKFDGMEYSLGAIIFDTKRREATAYIDLEGLLVTPRVTTLPKYCFN